MSEVCYTEGMGRRFIAGNIWCAQIKNTGRLPCLMCNGRGTIDFSDNNGHIHGYPVRNRCPECRLTGYADPEIWYLWFRLWVQFERRNENFI